MEDKETQWLRKHYNPAPTDGPAAKKIKFGDIHQRLSSEFPNGNFNATCVSDAIKSSFPHTLSKAEGTATRGKGRAAGERKVFLSLTTYKRVPFPTDTATCHIPWPRQHHSLRNVQHRWYHS